MAPRSRIGYSMALRIRHKANLLGRRWERLVLEVCDKYFLHKEVLIFVSVFFCK